MKIKKFGIDEYEIENGVGEWRTRVNYSIDNKTRLKCENCLSYLNICF